VRGRTILKLVLSLGVAGLPLAAAGDTVRQCDGAGAVVYCGAYSQGELVFKLNHGDGKNAASNLQTVLLDSGRGITQDGIGASVDGAVAADGTVTAGSAVVAHGAIVSARDNAEGSSKDGSLFQRPAAQAIKGAPVPAMVGFTNGAFAFAILKSNGDPVRAQPGAAAVAATGGSAQPMPPVGAGRHCGRYCRCGCRVVFGIPCAAQSAPGGERPEASLSQVACAR
jgi:hypothetical protein